MGRKLASLAGIIAAALAFTVAGVDAAGHATTHPAAHHYLAEDQGPTVIVP